MFGCREIVRLKNCVMMVVDVVVTMKMEIFRCSKVIVLMCVIISPVKYVAIRMVKDVGNCLFFIYLVKCKTFVLNNIMMHILFVLFFDCGYRVVIIEKMVGFIGILLLDND
jgi:hypothetical protein